MAFLLSVVIFLIVFSVVFRTNCSLETNSKNDDIYNSMDVPLVDSLDASLKAQLDISKLTKHLVTLITNKVKKEVYHANAELVESLVENITKQAEETMKTEIYNKITSLERGLTLQLILLITLINASECARVCYSCTNMADGDKCHYVETCHDTELCRKDISGIIFGKRTALHGHITCHRCCDKDICNSDVSCNDDFKAPNLPCASCSDIASPNTCNNKTLCEEDEVCFMHKYTTELHVRYDLGCKRSIYCLTGQSLHANGRRIAGGRHLICEACCRGSDSCNLNLQCDHHTQETINGSCTSTNDCTGNLICTTGSCQCPSIEFAWSRNTCELRRNVNGVCTSTSECKQPLFCREGRCSCPIYKYWDGSQCIARKTFNAYCKSNIECQATLLCGHGVCKCDRIDYWTGKNCSSRKTLNSSCTLDKECQETLLCAHGVCKCDRIHYWTRQSCFLKPKECADVLFDKDGIYDIYMNEYQSIKAYCMKDRSEIWTVIQRKFTSSPDFYKTWLEYKIGFGNVSKDHWLGNQNIHLISSNGRHKLRVLLTDTKGKSYYADYSTFRVDDENSKYRLTVTGYSGTAGDSMDKAGVGRSNGEAYSTKDRDNASIPGTCAVSSKGGWWYSNCGHSDLNGYGWWAHNIGKVTKSVMMVTRY